MPHGGRSDGRAAAAGHEPHPGPGHEARDHSSARLQTKGLRFRVHRKDLLGRPDLVFPKRRAVILVHGCFWHGHNCPMFKLPATRQQFWAEKNAANRERDRRAEYALLAAGRRVLTVWECSLKGPGRRPLADVVRQCPDFIRDGARRAELAGMWAARTIAARRSAEA